MCQLLRSQSKSWNSKNQLRNKKVRKPRLSRNLNKSPTKLQLRRVTMKSLKKKLLLLQPQIKRRNKLRLKRKLPMNNRLLNQRMKRARKSANQRLLLQNQLSVMNLRPKEQLQRPTTVSMTATIWWPNLSLMVALYSPWRKTRSTNFYRLKQTNSLLLKMMSVNERNEIVKSIKCYWW